MKFEKMILLAGLAGLVLGFYISITTTFMVLLLGFLIIPPITALASMIMEGISILSKEQTSTKKEYVVVQT